MTNATHAAGPSLTIRRTFNAPRERVFTAFTDADMMLRWMGPPGSSVTFLSFDAREGGTYRITFASPTYGEMTVKGTITTLRRPEFLAYTWRWEEADAKDEHDTSVRIEFFDRGTETEVLLMHAGFASEESRESHDMGWSSSFSKIDAVL